MNNLHTLTALTGRDSGVNRTIILKGFEARRRTVVVAAIGALPAIIVTAIAWTVVGNYALFALPIVEGLAFWLIESRSRTGLERRTYETLLDKKRSDAGQFYMCGRVIDPDLNELGTIVASTVRSSVPGTTEPAVAAAQPVTRLAMAGSVPGPASTASAFDADDLFGAPTGRAHR